MNISTLSAIAALSLIGAAACTTAENATPEQLTASEAADPRLGEQVDKICFTSSIDNFRDNTRRSVIIEKGANDEYYVETMGSCFDLEDAISLAFDSSPAGGCLSRGDYLIAFDSVFGTDHSGIAPQRCPIAAIYEWNEDAAEAETSEASAAD